MHPVIRQYCVLVEFLGKALGSDYEIVLHDLTTSASEVVAIANNHISEREVGAPLTDLALRFVSDKVYVDHDYKVNYKGKSKQQVALRCSTMFIKDESGTLLGMLCINFNTGKYHEMIALLSSMCQLVPAGTMEQVPSDASTEEVENLSESLSEVVHTVIARVLREVNLPADRLTQREKMKIVEQLSGKGVFLLKGAVSEVAAQLASSEATIYRYLSKLRR
ncbi:MAG: PAS domain-containing protein [Pygmaiobacter sp.]